MDKKHVDVKVTVSYPRWMVIWSLIGMTIALILLLILLPGHLKRLLENM